MAPRLVALNQSHYFPSNSAVLLTFNRAAGLVRSDVLSAGGYGKSAVLPKYSREGGESVMSPVGVRPAGKAAAAQQLEGRIVIARFAKPTTHKRSGSWSGQTSAGPKLTFAGPRSFHSGWKAAASVFD